MTNIFKQRIYRLCIVSATSFLAVTLSVVFLLAFTIIRSHPTIEEEGILALALFVAGACMCLARLSSSLD